MKVYEDNTVLSNITSAIALLQRFLYPPFEINYEAVIFVLLSYLNFNNSRMFSYCYLLLLSKNSPMIR